MLVRLEAETEVFYFFCSQKSFSQFSFKLHSLILEAELQLSNEIHVSCVGPLPDSCGNHTDFAEVNH